MALKTTYALYLQAATESIYLTPAPLTGSTDSIQVATDYPVFNYGYAFDGNRNGAPLSTGNLQPTAPSGRTAQGTVRIEGKGLGSAYSNAIAARVPNLHPFLMGGGLSASFTSTGGAQWNYRPYAITVTQPSSITLGVYSRGELLPISGAYCTWKAGAEGAAPTIFEFDVQGVAGTFSDTAVPNRAWSGASTLPPKNDAAQITIGSFTPVIRSWNYEHGLDIQPRNNQNTSGSHSGFAVGRRTPKLTLTIEQDALSSFNPYDDFNLGTSRAVTVTVGTVQYNRFSFSFPQCVLSNVEQGADGPTALWTLTYTPYVTTPDAQDDITLTFN